MSLQDKDGKNLFAVSEEEAENGGRSGAAFDDTKYMSEMAEWFLAGLLEGLPDSETCSSQSTKVDHS